MKYTFYILIILAAIFTSSCGDSGGCDLRLDIPALAQPANTYNKDVAEIDQFLDDNGLVADTTLSGLRYTLDPPGSDLRPTLCDIATVSFVGYYLDGTEFDSSEEFTFDLDSNLLQGWKEGMLLVGEGGTITIYLPSYIAYGISPPAGSGIPLNQVLVFEITLDSF